MADNIITPPGSDRQKQHTTERRRQRNPRKPISCEPCRKSKLRCDRHVPCGACRRREHTDQCKYHGGQPQDEAAVPAAAEATTATTTGTTSPTIEQETPLPASRFGPSLLAGRFGIPGTSRDYDINHGQAHANGGTAAAANSGDITRDSWDTLWQRPVEQQRASSPVYACPPYSDRAPDSTVQYLLSMLPPRDCCDYLVIQFFTYTAPMFYVVHEKMFQERYAAFMHGHEDGSGQDRRPTDDIAWLGLLFSMLSLAAQTLEHNDPILLQVRSRIPWVKDTASVPSELRQIAIMCLCRDSFLFHYHLTTLECLSLITYGISHCNGVDAAWTLLGLALNMAIALKCNSPNDVPGATAANIQRRRRCWTAILSLHTYQAILFRDIDLPFTLDIATPSGTTNDPEAHQSGTGPPPLQTPRGCPGEQVMAFKARLYKLARQVCRRPTRPGGLSEAEIATLDSTIASEQEAWGAAFLSSGTSSVFDIPSYAHWCLLEAYAHQLYLLLHRPFSRARPGSDATSPPRYRQASRWKCITSGAALLDLQRKYIELPRLRHHRWTINGMTGSCAAHGAMALASCLLEKHDDDGVDLEPYHAIFDDAVDRFETLQKQSSIAAKAYPILRHLQPTLRAPQNQPRAVDNPDFGALFDSWVNSIQWFDPNSVNWDVWENIAGIDSRVQTHSLE